MSEAFGDGMDSGGGFDATGFDDGGSYHHNHSHGGHHSHTGHSAHNHHHHHGESGLAGMSVGGHSTWWTSALREARWQDIFMGLSLSPAGMFFFMFLAFAGWLFFVYWVHHNEPVTRASHFESVSQGNHYQNADRLIVNGARSAMPFKAVHNLGVHPSATSSVDVTQFGRPNGSAAVTPQVVEDGAAAATAANYAQGVPIEQYEPRTDRNHYHVPVFMPNGTKLKTIVNK
jgi:hypothetical protein